MTRFPLAVLLSLAWLLPFVSAQPAPALPGDTGSNPTCLLRALELRGGLTLTPEFNPQRFEYQCSCSDWSKIGYGPGSPYIFASTMDIGSHAELWFNGVPVATTALGNHLSRLGPNASEISPPLATEDNQWKDGENLIQMLVGCHHGAGVPVAECTYEYVIKCNKPPDQGGEVVGDPQFVGLRGQSYQVHGVAGEVYNIVSDSDVQYNSRFVFLTAGDCPVVEGKKLPGCFSHPGSYLGELGLKTRTGDKIRIVAGPAAEGFAAVELNGRMLEIGEIVELSGELGSVSRINSHQTAVKVGVWDFVFENSDMFINQRVKVNDARSLRSHGLLGQTWRETTYENPIKFVQGAVDDYVIRDGDLFGDNFVYNAFN